MSSTNSRPNKPHQAITLIHTFLAISHCQKILVIVSSAPLHLEHNVLLKFEPILLDKKDFVGSIYL